MIVARHRIGTFYPEAGATLTPNDASSTQRYPTITRIPYFGHIHQRKNTPIRSKPVLLPRSPDPLPPASPPGRNVQPPVAIDRRNNSPAPPNPRPSHARKKTSRKPSSEMIDVLHLPLGPTSRTETGIHLRAGITRPCLHAGFYRMLGTCTGVYPSEDASRLTSMTLVPCRAPGVICSIHSGSTYGSASAGMLAWKMERTSLHVHMRRVDRYLIFKPEQQACHPWLLHPGGKGLQMNEGQ